MCSTTCFFLGNLGDKSRELELGSSQWTVSGSRVPAPLVSVFTNHDRTLTQWDTCPVAQRVSDARAQERPGVRYVQMWLRGANRDMLQVTLQVRVRTQVCGPLMSPTDTFLLSLSFSGTLGVHSPRPLRKVSSACMPVHSPSRTLWKERGSKLSLRECSRLPPIWICSYEKCLQKMLNILVSFELLTDNL